MELGYNKNLSYTYGHNTIQKRGQNWEKVEKKSERIYDIGDIYNYHPYERK